MLRMLLPAAVVALALAAPVSAGPMTATQGLAVGAPDVSHLVAQGQGRRPPHARPPQNRPPHARPPHRPPHARPPHHRRPPHFHPPRHPPRGWHRYQSRPWDWQWRGCIQIGPIWWCP